jgi:hypothetical protein
MLEHDVAKLILKAVDDHYWDTCDKDIITKHIIEGVLPVVINEILALPSDFEGLSIQDVLEQFGKMLDTLRDMSNLPDSYPIMAVCGRAEYAITHNGQPIRRRDEADTL